MARRPCFASFFVSALGFARVIDFGGFWRAFGSILGFNAPLELEPAHTFSMLLLIIEMFEFVTEDPFDLIFRASAIQAPLLAARPARDVGVINAFTAIGIKLGF